MIEARGLGARVGRFALDQVSFTVPARGYGVVIGPAGSGKTTLLETIAGIIPARSGAVFLGDRDVMRTPTEERGIGLVYQQGYLFPHLSVADNIAYGAADAGTAREAASRVGAEALYDRDVRALSGGERQVVALARTLATRPAVLLLDEPFSALDPRRRAHVRREVRALHREWGMTTLQVTHDFTEAGLLGDIVIVLDAGRVLQCGPPERVFRAPASPAVADLLGAENVLSGTVRVLDAAEGSAAAADWRDGADPGHAIELRAGSLVIYTVGDAAAGAAHAVIRADEITLAREPHTSSARNVFRGLVSDIAPLGALTRVTVDVRGTPLVATLTTRSVREMELAAGAEVYASFKAMAVHLC